MKKLLFILLAATMLFGCQKKDQETTPQFQDVSFNATEVLPEIGSRSIDDWICKDEDPTHAWVAITYEGVTTDYYPELFDVDGILYTQSLKLPVGVNYCIQDFVLFKDGNANGTYEVADDITTHGTPHTGSDYAGYVTPTLPHCFDVDAFEKEEIAIEVLCFEDVDYEKFGFYWFEITQIELSGFCFFGDICLNGEPFTPADFEGSLYGEAPLPIDVPAIMKILVYNDGVLVPNSEFNNELDQSEPLCAYYYDDPDATGEVFTFELYLWLPTETGFDYQLYYTYTSTDDGELMLDDGTTSADANDNGLLDFVVGTCNYNDIDQTFDFEWTPPPPPCNFNQGFEIDTDGWFDNSAVETYGIITRVATGTNGITSADGSWHAIFEGLASAPYTRFCGYSDTWTGSWTAEIDVYLDPAWINGEGFDYSVAATGTDGAHLQDFIFHVSKDISDDALYIGGSNNSNFATIQNLEVGNHYEITTAGWYTLQHVFRDDGGVLFVDLNLVDNGSLVWTETRTTPANLIPSVVGANRYGWFTFISVTNGIAVDETILVRP